VKYILHFIPNTLIINEKPSSMIKRSFTGLILAMLFGSASAQQFNFPDLPGYKKNTDFPVYTSDNLWDFINGAAELYLDYAFIDLNIAEYKKGKNIIKVEIYRHTDHTVAFGIYSTERSPTFNFMILGAQGYTADRVINFFKGNYYVKIRTFSRGEKTMEAAESLALRVADLLEGSRDMPSALSLFPPQSKKANEEMYINANVLGHKFLNKAFKATYEIGPDIFSVFILDTKTPEEALKTAVAYLTSTGIDPLESTDGRYVLSDGYNGTVFLSWKGSRIVIISGLSKDQADIADQYTSEILK
jgi:hypothetical protein